MDEFVWLDSLQSFQVMYQHLNSVWLEGHSCHVSVFLDSVLAGASDLVVEVQRKVKRLEDTSSF